MNITCTTAELNKILQTALHAIANKPQTTILTGFHLIAADDKLEVQGMDLNLAISAKLPVQMHEAGQVVVAAKQLAELVRLLPNNEVNIYQENDSVVKVVCGTSVSQLLLLNNEDFPKFPSFDGERSFSLSDEKIKDLLQKTVFACSADETRPLFTGILLEIADETITFVGTNTHRLAIRTQELSGVQPLSVIIPAKVLFEISRILGGEVPQLVTFSILKNQIMVKIEETTIVSRLIEGKFPAYRSVIPPGFIVRTVVKISDLAGAVERVALFSNESDYSIVKLYISAEQIKVSSSSPDLGTSEEIIAAKTSGEEINIAFNAKYLLDILKNLSTEEVELALNSSVKPACITSPGDDSYLYVVTPVRVLF